MNRHFSPLIPEKESKCKNHSVFIWGCAFIRGKIWGYFSSHLNVPKLSLKCHSVEERAKKLHLSCSFALTWALQAAIVVTFLMVIVALSVLSLVYRKELNGIINAATLIQTRNTNLYPLCAAPCLLNNRKSNKNTLHLVLILSLFDVAPPQFKDERTTLWKFWQPTNEKRVVSVCCSQAVII